MPIDNKPTYYEFFGLSNFESDKIKIKSAYRSMALKWHPDRCADKKEADSFGVSGTPGVFVNTQFQTGAISADQLKSAIDGELGK